MSRDIPAAGPGGDRGEMIPVFRGILDGRIAPSAARGYDADLFAA
jgi:hypothetical protein